MMLRMSKLHEAKVKIILFQRIKIMDPGYTCEYYFEKDDVTHVIDKKRFSNLRSIYYEWIIRTSGNYREPYRIHEIECIIPRGK